jgi:hypothetical protein
MTDTAPAPCGPADITPDFGETRIYREVVFDLETFDALKEWQRTLERVHRRTLTNSAVLRSLILSHPPT